MGKQRVRGAVKLGGGDDIAAAIGDIGKGVMQRSLTGCRGDGRDPAFKFRHAFFQHRDGRIGDAAVAVTFFLQIERAAP